MDPLGKKGEQAFEGVQNLSYRLEDLESHLEAVDAALQDFIQQSEHLLQQDYQVEEAEAESIDRLISRADLEDSKIEELEERMDVLESREKELSREIDNIVDQKIVGAIRHAAYTIERLHKISHNLRNELSGLEQKVEELEDKWVLEANKREYEFDQKLDKKEFESENSRMWEEIRKLRASVNVLAEELDKKDEIEVG